MRFAWVAAAVLAAGAASADPPGPRCTASTQVFWDALPGWTIEAFADGPDCARALAVFALRDVAGDVRWTATYRAEQNMLLAQAATNSEQLTRELVDWITPHGIVSRADQLPEWKDGESLPVLGDFVFYPAEGLDRAAYEAIRATKKPAFCYVQGMESLNCLVIDPASGEVIAVGIQTIAG